MKKSVLSEKTKNYLFCCYGFLRKLQREYENFEPTDSIANDFAAQILQTQETASQISRTLLAVTSYIPLELIAKDITQTHKKLEIVARRISENSTKNSNGAVYLFAKRNDILFSKTLFKIENMREFETAEKNYICQIVPLCFLKINISKNLLRFETDGYTELVAKQIIKDELQLIKKLRYLNFCIE